MRPNSTFYLMI